jgi:hypothetical protein
MPTGPVQLGIAAWIKIGLLFVALMWVAYTGIRLGPRDSRKWYDRTIRALGGLLVLALGVWAVIIVLREK